VIRAISLCLLVILFAGCEAQVVKVPPREGVPLKPVVAPASAPAESFDPEKIDVRVGNEMDLAALIEKHKGKVVFVDYWATWCEPCVEAFPHTVDAYEKYHDQGFTAIAVSFDEIDDELKVRRFLAEHRVRFENLINEYGIGTEYTEKFQLNAIPKFRLYDRKGKLRAEWDKKPPDLDARVKELLAEK
jgi:thiol-disulfide isomerase/thioredoxin